MTPEIIRGEDGRLIRVQPKKPLFRIKVSRRTFLAGLLALVVWILVGIAAWKLSNGVFGPRAPTLKNELDFQSAEEGFRFRAPNGWIRTSIGGKYPSGTAAQERKLVAYTKKGAHPASLEVSYIDLPPETDLGTRLAEASFGQPAWKQTAAATPLTVAGVDGNRYVFSAGSGSSEMVKEVVVFRRGERVFFFTGLFHGSDLGSQQQIRRALETLAW
ncbi:MAG: hypothetical protein ACJ8FY_21625 [Gemmataceae bacterium]